MQAAELKQEVEAYLERLVEILDEDVTLEIEEDAPDGLYVNLVGSMFSLPEERPSLTALEHLLRGALRRKTGQEVDVILDANGAVKMRRAELIRFALSTAESVARDHKRVRMNAMPAHERRTIHVTLANFPGVKTFSVGDGEGRRIVIEPDDG